MYRTMQRKYGLHERSPLPAKSLFTVERRFVGEVPIVHPIVIWLVLHQVLHKRFKGVNVRLNSAVLKRDRTATMGALVSYRTHVFKCGLGFGTNIAKPICGTYSRGEISKGSETAQQECTNLFFAGVAAIHHCTKENFKYVTQKFIGRKGHPLSVSSTKALTMGISLCPTKRWTCSFVRRSGFRFPI